ncbi:MAG TPA: hypothetical protein PLV92_21660, partial [Pirellulaceae bacterium]|nr:hypothetical protein [Pirellulaceae bacterium]
TINLTAAAAVVADSGPESDEGAFTVGANAPVSFDKIESTTVNGVAPGSSLTVNGMNQDDVITLIGNGTDDFSVSVDAGPATQYNNFGAVTLNGMSGSDRFDIDVNVLTSTAITINGQSPSTSGDSVTVTGRAGAADNAVFTPTGADSGMLAIAGLVAGNSIVLNSVESLDYNGESENESLTVLGTAGADTIVHTPGSTVDSGRVAVNSLLAIGYNNVGAAGSVTIDGQGGFDGVVAFGTSGYDFMTVDATTGTVRLNDSAGSHVPLLRTDAAGESLLLEGLDGDDDFTINLPQSYAFIGVAGDNSGGDDQLTINNQSGALDQFTVVPSAFGSPRYSGTISANATTVQYLGVGHIRLHGNAADGDDLSVFDVGLGDNHWSVKAGPNGDLIQIDDRESIEYTSIDAVSVVNVATSSDVFGIEPTSLSNYASFTVTGDGNDTLHLIGTDNADTTSQVASMAYTVNGKRIDWTASSISTLKLDGGDRADTFTVDLATLDAGVSDVEVAGGESSASGATTADILNVNVAASVRVTQST